MRQAKIADFEIWSFAWSKDLLAESRARVPYLREVSEGDIRVFRGVRPGLPFSELVNALVLVTRLRGVDRSHKFIHARTDYSAVVAGIAKKFKGLDVVWDCRGYAKAEAQARYSSLSALMRILGRYQVALAGIRATWAARYCSSAIFVTDRLRKMLGRPLGTKPYSVIPGVASERLFFYSPKLRQETRSKLGYLDADPVIVYSGSLTPYQRFPDTVKLFGELHAKDKTLKLLVLTPDLSAARESLDILSNGTYILLSARHDEVNAYLNAADFAIMLRSDTLLNAVAFPTKFSEYCLAGLPIIMSNSVPECYALADRIGNLVDCQDASLSVKKDGSREQASSDYQGLLGRRSTISEYARIYSFR